MTTEYDAHGNVTCQTNALGQENVYSYDIYDRKLCEKEIGKTEKCYVYNDASHIVSYFEEGKEIKSVYDIKGRPVQQTEINGAVTEHTYTALGMCKQTQMPIVTDSSGQTQRPCIHYTYDANNNIAIATGPLGDMTLTTYTALRKPVTITHPDQTRTEHIYYKNGTLASTTYADGSKIVYQYDPLHRKISERTFSINGFLLREERWEYDDNHLLAHTDGNELTTHFTYDHAGRKIATQALDRIERFEYDPLGFLEKTITDAKIHIEKHDILGRVYEQWDQIDEGSIQNHMEFFYDQDNRKNRAVRHTAQGAVSDLFFHDSYGCLRSHTDPYGHQTTIDYSEDDAINTTINPLGNRTIETFNALGHLIKKEKEDKNHATVFREEYYYDLAGNQIERYSTIFKDHHPTDTTAPISPPPPSQPLPTPAPISTPSLAPQDKSPKKTSS